MFKLVTKSGSKLLPETSARVSINTCKADIDEINVKQKL